MEGGGGAAAAASASGEVGGVVVRQVDDTEQEYIHEILSAHHQDALFKGWVSLQGPDKALRDRILVVSNFRIIALKVGEEGPQIQENIPIMDLKEIYMDKNDPFFLSLRFREDLVCVVAPQCIQIVEAVLFAHLAITYGVPDALLPAIKIPLAFIEEFTPPVPDEQTGLIASYLAICDYLEIPPRPQIIDYLITCFQSRNEELDLKNCLYHVEPKPTSLDIDALTTALRFNNSFRKLVVQGILLTDESVDMVAKIFGYNDYLTHLSLVNLKATKTGIAPFAASFNKGLHGLKSLKIIKFNIGDAGMEVLASALERSKQPIRRLCLVDVGMTSKGFKDLMKLLSNKRWAKAIKTLDVSENRIGKNTGSQSLAAWLQDAQVLEEFSASYCDLDLEVILESLKENQVLLTQSLESLNFSGSKMTSTAVGHMEQILINSVKLEHLYLAKTSMKKSLYEALFGAIKSNNKGTKFFIDLSTNDVGSQFGKSVGTIFDTPCSNISALILQQNELGAEGIISLCKSLRNLTALHTLVLDVNASKGLFTKINDVGTALAGLVQDLASLKYLSVAGDAGHFLKSGLIPLFNYLCENRTLTHLNVQSNKLQDDGFDALIDIVKKNQALQILDSDNNSWKLKYIRKLRDAMMLNSGLSHKSVIPFNDIATIYATYPKYKDEIHQLLTDIENRLGENERNSAQKLSAQDMKKHQKRMSWVPPQAFMFDGRSSVAAALDEMASHKIEEAKVQTEQPEESAVGTALEDVKEEKEESAVGEIATKPQELPEPAKPISRSSTADSTPLRTSVADTGGLAKPEVKSQETKTDVAASPAPATRKAGASTSSVPSGKSSEKPMERTASSTFIANDDIFAANTFSLDDLKGATLYTYDELKDASALPAGVVPKYKEMFLKDDIFQKVMGCSKQEYLGMPRWRQVRKKREVGLF